MSITVLPLQLGKPRHDCPPSCFPVGFRKSPAFMTSEGLLFLPRRHSEPHVLRCRRRRAASAPPQPRDSPSAQLHPPCSPVPSSGRSSGQGLAVPPILPASLPPIPSVQEAPSQVPRRDVRADATQESSGGDAGAAGGERAGPFALRRPGCRVWGRRSASPAGGR